MGLKDKLPQMSEEEQLRLLATNGMLVKRPLVIGEDYVLTGFKEKEWAENAILIDSIRVGLARLINSLNANGTGGSESLNLGTESAYAGNKDA